MIVFDLGGAPVSYRALMESYIAGMIEPTQIKAEPKTMENVLRLMLPYVCSPKYTGYRTVGVVQHAPKISGFGGPEIPTIAFMFEGAGFKVDETLDKGTILFEVYGHPEQSVKIINIAVD